MELSGEKLRSLRLERFWPQQELADRAGMTEATVKRLAKGLHSARISTIRKLAAALSVEPAVLLADTDDGPMGKAAGLGVV